MSTLSCSAEAFAGALAGIAIARGDMQSALVLKACSPKLSQYNTDWGSEVRRFQLTVQIAPSLFVSFGEELDAIRERMRLDAGCVALEDDEVVDAVAIRISPLADGDWRAAIERRIGGVNNQANVRSDNMPSLRLSGLRFRSQPEINLYQALREYDLTIFPLPVATRGKKRIEPDFVIFTLGRLWVIEVDGPSTHTERPVEAHERLEMLTDQGACVLRVRAEDCASTQASKRQAERLMRQFGILAKAA